MTNNTLMNDFEEGKKNKKKTFRQTFTSSFDVCKNKNNNKNIKNQVLYVYNVE